MNIQDFQMDFFSLKGKNAIVTGGNSGLGQAFALALAKAGANLFIPSIVADDGTTERLISEVGGKMVFMQADITKEGVPKQVIDGCVEALGSVDILVNSAGICKIAEVQEFGRKEWDPMIQLNLTAAFELSYEASKRMIPQRSGKIINICSLFSFLGGQWSPAYAATKHGIAGLTKAYCDELAQYNIQVNGIAPGYYATEITSATRSNPETNQRVLDHIPANRWGETQDLMGTTVFLASRASDYVNGHLLVVDGGYLVR
ncbi:short-chain dehydrogenase/reductase SDR [Listeria grandensis FSL F6-0971]|uniref:Short-chain dehydrogenase/reductase SDR n=1 Tax=Listeria grandensis FSL F6-0971 TaxID=1265819 RepID=W7BKG6_9LIST|nr:SDR family oxidoreductase [Listeria grandensis]EUJ23706.1 short-chain dehydrogenase/reductase SDR [Listeria grandensis FSL F6-0971]